MLKEIKSLLGVEVKLAQMKLENGTILEAEEFAPDYEVFIVTEDEKVALPVGEYALEDGKVLVVEEEGIIKEIKEVSGEEQPEEEAPVEAPVEEEMAEEVEYATKEEVENLKSMIEELKSMMLKKEEELAIEEQVKEELSSQPAAEPIKHSPETKTTEVKRYVYSQQRALTTHDRVLQRISNLKNK